MPKKSSDLQIPISLYQACSQKKLFHFRSHNLPKNWKACLIREAL